MISRRSLALVLGPLLVASASGCPTEDFGPPLVLPPDATDSTFFDVPTTTTVFVDAGPTTGAFDSGGTGAFDTGGPVGPVEYYRDVRPRLATCASCHGADGPVSPRLHSYIAARNAASDVQRALANGHDGNFSRLAVDCTDRAPSDLTSLAELLRAWSDLDFPTGTLVPLPEEPTPPRPPDASLAPSAMISPPTPRCFVLGDMPGAIERLEFQATELAWVELYAVAPAFETAIVSAAAADSEPGWTCGSDLALVPQPLVAYWQLGATARDFADAPFVAAPGSILVARTARAPLALLTAAPPTLRVDAWIDTRAPSAIRSVTTSLPLHTTSASLEVPWLGPPTTVFAATSDANVALLQLYTGPSATCIQSRGCGLAACDPPPSWPGTAPLGTASELTAGVRLELSCADDGPCGAQLHVVGPDLGEVCSAKARACASQCPAAEPRPDATPGSAEGLERLACITACAETDDDQCSLCVLMGQLTCRHNACEAETRLAFERLTACASAIWPSTCILDTVFEPLETCDSPLCEAALAACAITP